MVSTETLGKSFLENNLAKVVKKKRLTIFKILKFLLKKVIQSKLQQRPRNKDGHCNSIYS